MDDDERKPSVWAHLGCRITAFGRIRVRTLKTAAPAGFCSFSVAVLVVAVLSLSTQPLLFLRLLGELTGVEEGNLAATTCAGPPPAAGGRNEPRRAAPALPPRKTQEEEEEDGGEERKWRQGAKRDVLRGSGGRECRKTKAKVCVIQQQLVWLSDRRAPLLSPFSDPVIRWSSSATKPRQATDRKCRNQEMKNSDFRNKSGVRNVKYVKLI